jgi:hypothetical protein
MKNKNELHIIEKKYDLEKLKINNLYAWPILRQRVYFEIIKKKFDFNAKLRTRSNLKLLKNAFYGIEHVFKLKKYDFLFFNNADKRTLTISNKQYDVFFDAWADKVGQDKSLFIEWAIDKHFPKSQTYSKNTISDLLFKFCCYICSKFVKTKISDYTVLNKIKKEYDFDFNLEKELRIKVGEIIFFKFIFRFVKPKTIFLISSFTKTSIVIAAHLEGIKVYEMQHGFIGENHQFYNSAYNFESMYYPDYLISFGETEKTKMPQGFIFNQHQIIPVGSLQLEDIKENFHSSKLESTLKPYDKVFCVTLQTVKEKELLTWVNALASKNKDWFFIIKPKNNKLDYTKFTELNNCSLLPEVSTYMALKYSHYNITIYSTTAVEASFFGVKTLFYNIENLSSKYFDVDSMYAALIDPDKPFDESVLSLDTEKGKLYFTSNYSINVANTNLDI